MNFKNHFDNNNKMTYAGKKMEIEYQAGLYLKFFVKKKKEIGAGGDWNLIY